MTKICVNRDRFFLYIINIVSFNKELLCSHRLTRANLVDRACLPHINRPLIQLNVFENEMFMKKEILKHRMFLAVVFELHTNASGNIVLCNFLLHLFVRESSQTTQRPTERHHHHHPRSSKKPHLPKCFLNLYREGASLASVEMLFHILALRKEKAFCPCPVFFLGSRTPYLCCGGYGKNMHYF